MYTDINRTPLIIIVFAIIFTLTGLLIYRELQLANPPAPQSAATTLEISADSTVKIAKDGDKTFVVVTPNN